MLIFDFRDIGNKLYANRKRLGMTQAEVAEAAGLADRTYADIERGTVNMRIETLLRICTVLHVTPDSILTDQPDEHPMAEQIVEKLSLCSPEQQKTALDLLDVYLNSLN
ncbi:MAG: helix-turn-helix transcriptional regulator [Ruminococcaceae bacterium]|nr:helix-turn-helix transcriptional regulator [Oscillospiraceae bacterium]